MTSPEPTKRPAAPAAGYVAGTSSSPEHGFSKVPRASIRLVEDLGVEADAHAGTTVQHRSRVAKDPSQPNLRQVHLIHTELFDELVRAGHPVSPGDLGENMSTTGVDLLSLPAETVLLLGEQARVRLTGLRNPCHQIDAFQPGLLRRLVGRDQNNEVVRKAGVMAVVVRSGTVRAEDPITVLLPAEPHLPLAPV